MRTYALLVALAVLAPACAAESSDSNMFGTGDLDAHRMQWSRPGRYEYSFTWKQICFCPSEVTRAIRVEVDEGKIVKATYVDDSQPVSDAVKGTLLTIEGVFDLIEHGFEAHYDVVRVEYGDQGYPADVMIDVSKQGADDERSIQISDIGGLTRAR